MKRFSKTLPITKGNLACIPEDTPGVIRIRNKDGRVLFHLPAKAGRIAEQIWTHRGGAGKFKAASFQYCTTATMEEAEKVRREQSSRLIFPSLWRLEQRRRRREAQNV